MPEHTGITYRKGYKYQLRWTYDHQLRGNLDHIPEDVHTLWLTLTRDGLLTIKGGYAWDGGSGPARDTQNAMRAFLLHDAGYQLTRLGFLKIEIWRPRLDQEFRRILREDKVSRFRAWYLYRGVRIGGKKAASPAGIRRVLHAP